MERRKKKARGTGTLAHVAGMAGTWASRLVSSNEVRFGGMLCCTAAALYAAWWITSDDAGDVHDFALARGRSTHRERRTANRAAGEPGGRGGRRGGGRGPDGVGGEEADAGSCDSDVGSGLDGGGGGSGDESESSEESEVDVQFSSSEGEPPDEGF